MPVYGAITNSAHAERRMRKEETHRSNATPTVTDDADVKALYIQLTDADVLETVELADNVYLDIDADGQPVGFEVLNADAALLASLPALPETGVLSDLLKPRAA